MGRGDTAEALRARIWVLQPSMEKEHLLHVEVGDSPPLSQEEVTDAAVTVTQLPTKHRLRKGPGEDREK